MKQTERVRQVIAGEAAQWFVANRQGLMPRERAEFADWLQSSPVHVEEYLALSIIAQDLGSACGGLGSVEELVAQARLDAEPPPPEPWVSQPFRADVRVSSRWQSIAIAAVMAVVVLGIFSWWDAQRLSRPAGNASRLDPAPEPELHFETGHGEQQIRQLADHSILRLNTDSAVTIKFDTKRRLAVLTAGEAHFDVAHEPQRAFHVISGSTEIVAVGTQFDVRRVGDTTSLTVVDGHVTVAPRGVPAHDAQTVNVGPDQQVNVLDGAGPSAPVSVDARKTTAWMRRQIAFEREPLERVASEFNRYSAIPIEIVSPGLRKLEVSGVFATDDMTAFIAFLRSLDGVHVEETNTRIRVSRD